MSPQEESSLALADSVERLPGIGPQRAALLAQMGIVTLADLLYHVPRAFHDRRRIGQIADAREGEELTVCAEIVKARAVRLRGRQSICVATLRDESGEMGATWFGRGFLANAFKENGRWLLTGKVGSYKGLALKNPEYELLAGDEEDLLNTGRIVPVYRLTEGVTQRMLRRMVRTALDAAAGEAPESLPAALRARHGLPPIGEAIGRVHFPGTLEEAALARRRFAYEELLAIQLGVLQRRAETKGLPGHAHRVDGPHLKALRDSIPFALTPGQRRATGEVLADMAAPRPMLRLLQGDVGCGKTVVAMHAVAAACDGGFQCAFMAPTEILAEQHAESLRAHLEAIGIRVACLTGSSAGARALRAEIARGAVDVVAGTHALFQEATAFHRLGLVVIDEQHRFGVMQRGRLVDKGAHPDVLHMTATPIPRSLAITVYGGMDLSLIDELPPGRRPVKTRRVPETKLEGLYTYLREQAAVGRQAYFICPLVEESEKRALTAVTRHFEELSRGPLAGLRTAVLHGRMAPSEKLDTVQRFKRGEIDVLFSTTVIEVGIDVPAATIMVIEDAGQFGLTQLHQLRGRVGRGADESFCFLLGKPKTSEARERLRVLCDTASGFAIAEADLKLRGPGEFYGVRQAGIGDLRVADLIEDVRLLEAARHDAEAILAADPHLSRPEHGPLALASRRVDGMIL